MKQLDVRACAGDLRKTSALGGVRCLAPALAGFGSSARPTREAQILGAAARNLVASKRLPPLADVRPGCVAAAAAAALEQHRAVSLVSRLADDPPRPLLPEFAARLSAELAFVQEMWQTTFEVYSRLANEYRRVLNLRKLYFGLKLRLPKREAPNPRRWTVEHFLKLSTRRYIALYGHYVAEYITLYGHYVAEFPPGLLCTPASWAFWAPASGVYTDDDEALLAVALLCHAEKVGPAARPLVDATLNLFRRPLTLKRWRRRRAAAAGTGVAQLTEFERIITNALIQRLNSRQYASVFVRKGVAQAGPVDVARLLLKHLCREKTEKAHQVVFPETALRKENRKPNEK
jgi:hypothetical protein